MSYWLIIGSILGLLSVLLGAFGAHGLKGILLKNETLEIFNKAVLYQIFHTIALLCVGNLQIITGKSFFMTGIFFTLGVIIFSGSLYILSITNLRWLGAITPIGGVLFVFGWITFFLNVIK
tara:strand:- start:1558 stop:1920 length:363 start_codon:yes stop_codon:yes gene_type:complete